MPAAGDRGGLKSAFAGFKKTVDEEAELKLLGRTVDDPPPVVPAATAAPEPMPAVAPPPPVAAPAGQGSGSFPTPSAPSVTASYQPATNRFPSGLTPRPLRQQKEAVRQLSFRCPVSLAAELRRKALYNQLEHQEIIVEGIRRVLAELEEPPAGWIDRA